MTEKTLSEQLKDEFTDGFRGDLYAPLFEVLEAHGLKAHKSSHTLLFKWRDAAGEEHNLIAFRRKPDRVVSFPKSHWQARKSQVDQLCQEFTISEKRSPSGDSFSKESCKEVLLNEKTIDRLRVMCERLCSYAQSQGY